MNFQRRSSILRVRAKLSCEDSAWLSPEKAFCATCAGEAMSLFIETRLSVLTFQTNEHSAMAWKGNIMTLK
jgi:hypothetical protein